ncbi:PREDICTED: uncharacterized protein LOC109208796 [Nicotiana attenuata]|uniref:uncharacterized protein LOC109208796 n=1 Tax=Nicotiana attenuata TaxID=49451 RepID=UPI000905A5EB|nr:PREDICTED: uncharacterized protein LOC109208796 [Nicotiana attenuata]
MRINGEALDEVKVVEKILRSLSIKFHTKKLLLEATKDLNTFTLDDLEGCSDHISGNKKLFIGLDEIFRGTVRLENNAKVPAVGKGKIRITVKDGSSNFISDVFYVQSLHHNLLSLGQLSKKGV